VNLVAENFREVQQRFGLRMRELRLARGLSQERLALETGLNRTYLGSVERGERNISLINIAKLAAALNVQMRDLLDG
jgi:transcriptional regulator with XRE-family HTH domain